jgi:hypothetical protein
MHITDLKTLMTVVNATTKLSLYYSINLLNHLTHLPLTYVKSTRHSAGNYKPGRIDMAENQICNLHEVLDKKNFIYRYKDEVHVHTIASS